MKKKGTEVVLNNKQVLCLFEAFEKDQESEIMGDKTIRLGVYSNGKVGFIAIEGERMVAEKYTDMIYTDDD